MKKVISAILAISIVLSTGIFTFASNLDEIYESKYEQEKKEETEKSEENTESNTDNLAYTHIPSFLRPTDQLYKLFVDILNLYTEQHLYDFTQEEVLYKFIYDMIATHPEFYELMLNTMLKTMDPYSGYYEGNSGFLSLDSKSAGYGITVAEAENGILIKKVSKQSEAEKAGILPGDVITGVFGYDTSDLPWYLISLLLKSPYVYVSKKNSDNNYPDYNPEIQLTVNRNGETLHFKLKKGVVITDELSSDYLEDNGQKIAYISISSFLDENISANFLKEIQRFKADGYNKLVVDLRDNGGGSPQLAVEMAEVFVDNGEILCYYNDKSMEKPTEVISDTEKIDFESISVLVNENTASAAELMASILRNKAGAVLVGKTTVGKAIGQTVYTLGSQGASFTITTYEVLDSNGVSYNEIGLVPELILDPVEMMYFLPQLEHFNHVNYKEITEGTYSEPCLALEKRLAILGYLKESVADGIWDDSTKLSIYFLQRTYFASDWTGVLDDRTVTLITNLINDCKDDTYYEDSQLECALIYHSSFDQAKRLIEEKVKLAEEQAKIIEETYAMLDALYDAEN